MGQPSATDRSFGWNLLCNPVSILSGSPSHVEILGRILHVDLFLGIKRFAVKITCCTSIWNIKRVNMVKS